MDTFARDGLPPAELWPELRLGGAYAYPDRLNAATNLLDDAVRDGDGDHVAIISRDGAGAYTATTYRELQRQADAIAHVLVREMGLVSGNRVLLRGYNGATLAATWLAVLKAGAVAVTTMPMLRAIELQAVMEKARCSHALCDRRLEAELQVAIAESDVSVQVRYWEYAPVEAAPSAAVSTEDAQPAGVSLNALMQRHVAPFASVDTSSDDVCLIAFTSGTTGVPKGCMHFHRDVMAMCDGFSAHTLRLSAHDRCIGTPPLAFTFGLGALLAFSMHARASTVLLETATP
ncbi:MAG: AMP-binding protein, partial [Gemmatimonadaceae bacterium]